MAYPFSVPHIKPVLFSDGVIEDNMSAPSFSIWINFCISSLTATFLIKGFLESFFWKRMSHFMNVQSNDPLKSSCSFAG
ncbi:hypothetical protein BpHYR1_047781 [Brachionus plicatilis]|uniref:Uncharacterized protein n=1 Tax=Brachionus plicatilis TaxID=10195 RepID=A0A3M7T8H6_BRAPC|nr:hypothetical protein BpHYR1_047781 [Brachionus plicatilis]